MNLETWHKLWCSKCLAPQWVNNGDPSDQTVADVEAVECYVCGHVMLLGEDEEIPVEEVLRNAYRVMGKARPE